MNMKKHITFRIRILLILMVSVFNNSNAETFTSYFPKGADEGIFLIKYSNVVKTTLNTVIYKDSIYLPITAIFSILGIDYRLENGNKSISGFFINTDSTYRISFTEGKAIYNDRQTNFTKDQFLLTDIEIYLQPSLISQIFGIELKSNFNDLEVKVMSRIDLPVLEQAKRNENYNNSDFATNRYARYGPLLYNRSRSYLNGAMLDYNINATQTLNPRNRYYSYNFNSGAEIMGGDFQLTTNGTYDERTKVNVNRLNYRWRYYVGDNPYLTQIVAGQITSGGFYGNTLPSIPMQGIQLSNDPAMRTPYFSTIVIEDQINPEWQVELWINNQLYGQKQCDMTGYYRFDLPVNYGYTNIELRYYGPKGEVVSKKDFLNIPSEFLNSGDIRYAVSGGRDLKDNNLLTSARLTTGITSFLTNSILATKTIGTDSFSIVNHLALRIYKGFTSSVDISPNNYYRATLSSYTQDYGGANLMFTKYDGEMAKSMINQTTLSFGIPRFTYFPFGTSVQMIRTQRAIRNEYNIIANMNTSYNSIFLNALYRTIYYEDQGKLSSTFQTLLLDLNYTIYNLKNMWEFLNSTRVGVSSLYNMTSRSVYNTEIYMNKLIGRSVEVKFGVNYNFALKQPVVLAGVLLNLPSLRSNTTGNFDPKRSSIMQSVQSTLAFDSFQNELLLTNSGFQSSVGMGAVTVRFFLDENEDGKYTAGETFIPDVVFNIPGITISQGQDKTESRVHNLMPYAKYNLVINMESFKNPLWTPIAKEFSFIADPNTYKPIDVPCYSAGIIEGGVMRDFGKEKRGQAGIKIHIMKVDSTWKQEVSVFADGNFYYMGVPPGEYYATIDSIQMSILNVYSEPKSLPFTVRKTSSGDMVSNVNFNLISNVPGVIPEETEESKKVIAASIIKPDESAIDKAGNYLNKLIPKDTNQIVDNKNLPIEDKTIPTKDILSPVDANIKMENSLTFKTSKMTYLTVPMQRELDRIADYLQKNPNARLQIDGHTDNFGTPSENLAVSNTRASEVVNYLTRKGIKKDRLLSAGHGALKAKADNLTESGRAKNRRVELKIIDNK